MIIVATVFECRTCHLLFFDVRFNVLTGCSVVNRNDGISELQRRVATELGLPSGHRVNARGVSGLTHFIRGPRATSQAFVCSSSVASKDHGRGRRARRHRRDRRRARSNRRSVTSARAPEDSSAGASQVHSRAATRHSSSDGVLPTSSRLR